MKMRCFIAVNLPSEIKDYLNQIILELERKNQMMNIKWVNPEGLHFTLHFLGNIDEKQIEQVKEIISQSVKDKQSVEVEIGEIDGFPNLDQPRVLFISCREVGDNILKIIQEGIGKQLEKIGIEVDKRPWRMHITFCRLRRPRRIQNSKLKIKNLRFRVKSIDLMKSELSSEGAKYTIIERFFLKPSL
jgi:2'-5' RNA ligase